MPPFAHAADYFAVVPVAGFIVWLAITELRRRRELRQRGGDVGSES